MTLESIFLIISISALTLILIYEIIFILFFNISSSKTSVESETEAEDVIIQPRPLGYDAPPAGKIQQCSTPIFEISKIETTEVNHPEAVIERVQEKVKVPLVKNIRKTSTDKAPIIVVSSPTSV